MTDAIDTFANKFSAINTTQTFPTGTDTVTLNSSINSTAVLSRDETVPQEILRKLKLLFLLAFRNRVCFRYKNLGKRCDDCLESGNVELGVSQRITV